ncbi:hypothetical protein [Emticicia sp. W12TSBA100-4]|uniref:hypothetical protein n=1 Tax=Emticicia sp. W12TSBA100-4 TaxID=3160965 RepID=UPI0033056279
MKVFEANITYQVADYLNFSLKDINSFETANQKLFDAFGITLFFDNNEELETLKENILLTNELIYEPDRSEYGDFQTNEDLAKKVSLFLSKKLANPQIIIEPTCGKGNFIIASLANFSSIENIYGIEIYKPYVWETKFNIIEFYLNNPQEQKAQISIIHSDVFEYDFKKIAKQYSEKEILVIGNPPWVTNAKLGSLNSSNLPKKANFKNQSGLDAMTGKGNFDIAEFIMLKMLEIFQSIKGNLLFLVKNSVIKNILTEQKKNKYTVSEIEKYCIDSKKEFNVSVEASLLFCQFKSNPAYYCTEYDFYNAQEPILQFGWLDNKFVSNIDIYSHTKNIDGECPFVWRQGLKHDCSSIMELDKSGGDSLDGYYVNGLNEEIKLEDDLVYGLLKSSDLKNTVINQTRKFTIVTQKKVGQETKYIKHEFPKTFQYLIDHQDSFNARKSSIYNNKPAFSIFGVGDYSFKPYKVAISGLYKTFHFTLILPQNEKPVMLDDTCYLLGFDKIEFAVYTLILLNSEITVKFLQSVTFADAKRTFTKDVLMRIDLLELANTINRSYLELELQRLNDVYNFNLKLSLWNKFIEEMSPVKNKQVELFA